MKVVIQKIVLLLTVTEPLSLRHKLVYSVIFQVIEEVRVNVKVIRDVSTDPSGRGV